jgi:hypothetical protein
LENGLTFPILPSLDDKTDLESQNLTISEPVNEGFEKCEECLEVVSSNETFL